jgi:hypothetical protein
MRHHHGEIAAPAVRWGWIEWTWIAAGAIYGAYYCAPYVAGAAWVMGGM